MDVADTERRIAALREPLCRCILDIPSPAWLSQHASIESLSLSAHSQARTASHALVLDTLLSCDKYHLLTLSLLACDLWRCHVLPALPSAPTGDALTRVYFVLYHECLAAQFIALTLYHDYVCDNERFRAVVDDLLDLAVRNVNSIIAVAHARKASRGATPATGTADQPQLKSWLDDMNLKRGCAGVTILRYLMEHAERLPISVTSRLLDTHDVLLGAAALIENPPWVRKLARGAGEVVWQKYDGNAWGDVPPGELLRVTALDAQPWLTIFALVRSPPLRGRYAMHPHRLSSLSRVRKYMNEALNEQIPVLAGVQRWLDELAIAGSSSGTGSVQAGLLISDVHTVQSGMTDEALGRVTVQEAQEDRTGMLFITAPAEAAVQVKSGDAPVYLRTWTDVAAHVADKYLNARDRGDLKALANVYGDDAYEEAAAAAPRCASCGGSDAHKRCSRCRNAFYCSRACQVADWDAHKAMCDLVTHARPAERLDTGAAIDAPVMPLVMPTSSVAATVPKASSAPLLVARAAGDGEGKEEAALEAEKHEASAPAAAAASQPRRMLIQEMP